MPQIAPIEFSTSPFPPRQRFEAYRAWASSWFEALPAPDAGHPPDDFRMRQAAWRLGGLGLVHTNTLDPSVTARAAARARRDLLDHWGVHVLLSGSARASMGETRARGGPGQAHLFSLRQDVRNERTAVEALLLCIPREAAPPDLAAALDARLGAKLGGPVGELLLAHIAALPRALEAGLTPGKGAAAAEAALALLRATVLGRDTGGGAEPGGAGLDGAGLDGAALDGAGLDGAAPGGAEVGGAEAAHIALARAQAAHVMRLIRHHLAEPDLRPDRLERLAGLPRSRLYALLDRQGGVARAILRERLKAAARALSDRTDARAIGRVAESVGLPDAAVFSRAFRREFGVSPRDWRERAALGLGAAHPSGAVGAEAPRDIHALLSGLERG